VSPESRARIRAVWAQLAGVGKFPARGSVVAVSNASRICPPGWAGVVGLDAGLVATVPHAGLVASVTRVLEGCDWEELALDLRAQEVLGPAQLAYADRGAFVASPVHTPVEMIHTGSVRVERFVSSAPESDAQEAGVASCTSPMFCVIDGDQVVAAAGYRVWCEELAHMSVLVAPDRRGVGLARGIASAATEHALANGLLAQWRAVPPASQAVAAALGYEPMGHQISLRVL
jgi:hypothetical protein